MGKYNDKAIEKLIKGLDSEDAGCPSDYGLKDLGLCRIPDCIKCWQQALMQEPEGE